MLGAAWSASRMLRTALIPSGKPGPESVPQEQSNSKHTVPALGGLRDLGTWFLMCFDVRSRVLFSER